MNQTQRMLAFFGALLITFGITDLDFENPAFDQNKLAYVAIVAGIITLILFLINKLRS
jgi:hypothetical protein